jgi:hypothetical protein
VFFLLGFFFLRLVSYLPNIFCVSLTNFTSFFFSLQVKCQILSVIRGSAGNQ